MRRPERGTDARPGHAPAVGALGAPASRATTRSDHELLREIACGDRAAFGELYDRFAPSVLAVSARLLGSRREAEDVAHDVFLECWRDAALYDPTRASVRTWLLVRTRSRSLDRIRAARRAATLALDDSLLDRFATHASDPATQSDRGMLAQLLRQLTSEQRIVVELGYFAGYSTAEIAVELAIPIGTVKSRMMRALDKLRLLLRRCEGVHR